MALKKGADQSHMANLSIGAMIPIAELGEPTVLKPSMASFGFAESISNKGWMPWLDSDNI
ncbi:hypothetical protein [Brucella thiophenivorans]|uniref:Uncharacterized protein n=1 Tax=Brucella thiophenivorans TaxID=571255 RepID=A0A256FU78_9HYPH|nr:hypothetical protein [Brucella thiophenivorans]OYR18276.1 hypothetical protein CEV31_4288 [Brucella thiophenivorans]